MDNKRNLAFSKTNFIMIAVGMAVVVIGFLLMISTPTTEEHFSEDMFSTRCITVAPVMSFLGFIFMIVGVIYSPSERKKESGENSKNLNTDELD